MTKSYNFKWKKTVRHSKVVGMAGDNGLRSVLE